LTFAPTILSSFYIYLYFVISLPLCNKYSDVIDIYLYTLCYYMCCLFGACMRCTRLCPLKPGVTAMQDAARRALSQYCSLFGGVADGLNLRYYPRRPTGNTESVVVSPIGEDNPRLSSTVNLVAVLNTELDHSLDELSRARTEIAELRAELAERHHQEGGSPAPVGTQHPYRSPPRGHHTYGSPACKTRIDLDP
jgi:hypothetical protein